tara:strand:- start:2800 stop:3564 length:765 start_codon:yes stop_codon:yes gene_type:complete
MDPTATNYNSEATLDNGDCNYANISGCTDSSAINYLEVATTNDGSCQYLSTNINFKHYVDGIELVVNEMIYTNQSNDNYSIQTLRYLISDITLHTDNGDETLLDEVHFIDISIDSTLILNISQINYQNYTFISFTMGLDSLKNITNLFLNENFFPSFVWPEFLGGGYHYMQLEGDFNTVFNGYTTHTGGTNGLDFSFNKMFPINEITDININMEITNWYKNPEIFDLTTDGIMGDINKQVILKANGIEDVYSVN